jgi:Ca2+-binding EF-hand superfamily protein
MLLFGDVPFPGRNVDETKPRILANKPKYLSEDPTEDSSKSGASNMKGKGNKREAREDKDDKKETEASEADIRISLDDDDEEDAEADTEPPHLVSEEAKAFIRRCLKSDPAERPSADMCLLDDWFAAVVRVDGGKGLSMIRIHDFAANPHALDKVTGNTICRAPCWFRFDYLMECYVADFTRKSALSRFCIEVLAYSIPSADLRTLRKEFHRYDIDNDGEINKEDFRAAVQKLQAKVNADEMFETINYTNSGVINYHEFLAAMLDLSKVPDEHFRYAFELISLGKPYFDINDVARILGVDSSFEQVAQMLKDAKFSSDARITFATVRSDVHRYLNAP